MWVKGEEGGGTGPFFVSRAIPRWEEGWRVFLGGFRGSRWQGNTESALTGHHLCCHRRIMNRRPPLQTIWIGGGLTRWFKSLMFDGPAMNTLLANKPPDAMTGRDLMKFMCGDDSLPPLSGGCSRNRPDEEFAVILTVRPGETWLLYKRTLWMKLMINQDLMINYAEYLSDFQSIRNFKIRDFVRSGSGLFLIYFYWKLKTILEVYSTSLIVLSFKYL